MKKYIQNVLAQNSSGEIMYICGKCGAKVDKEATICPKCNSRLGKIKCPFCNFTGEIEDFKDDTCPRCGRKKEKIDKKDNSFIIKNKYNFSISKKVFWLLFFSLLLILFFLILVIIYHYNII